MPSSVTPSLTFFDTVSHWLGTHKLSQTSWPVSLRGPPVFVSSALEVQMHAITPGIFLQVLEIERCSLCLQGKPLLTEASLHLTAHFFHSQKEGSQGRAPWRGNSYCLVGGQQQGVFTWCRVSASMTKHLRKSTSFEERLILAHGFMVSMPTWLRCFGCCCETKVCTLSIVF